MAGRHLDHEHGFWGIWELVTSRVTATEQGLTLERQERGQLVFALQAEAV